MKLYRYILDKSSKKYSCPNCGKKSFVRYIDTETGKYISNEYGRCDREVKCAYYKNPYKNGDFFENSLNNTFEYKQRYQSQPVFIPVEVLYDTYGDYGENVFIQNLMHGMKYPFCEDDVVKVINLYRLGNIHAGYRKGAITFPFIDIHCNIRAVQVKQFDKANHTIGTDFLHSIIEKQYNKNKTPPPKWLNEYNKNETKVSCLFGEHLLNKYPNNPIALVEAPKTGVYCTLYFGFPEMPSNMLWLAVYNKSSFSLKKLSVLKGRTIYTFPDLSENGETFKEWQDKANKFERLLPGTRFIFSDLLERIANKADKKEGYDIADYLTKMDWRMLRDKL